MKRKYQSPNLLVMHLEPASLLAISGDPEINKGSGELSGSEAMTNKERPYWADSNDDAWE
ncbi:MAG: hypothetical protein ACI3X6_04960 [Alloprevotella sp.]